jgi:hypothetical protein
MNTRDTYPRYRDFLKERALVADVISLDTALFRYPFRVAVTDSVAVVLDLHNADHYLHAFTYPQWRHIVSFGKRGNGPEELLSAETFQFDSPDSLWVLDANRMQITRWEINRLDKSAERLDEVTLDKQLIRVLDFHKTADGFIVPDYSGEYRYHLLNGKGDVIQSAGIIPTERKQVQSPALAQAWRSFIDYNPHRNTLALATQLGEVLEIVTLDNDTGRVLYGPNGEPAFQASEGEGIPVGIMGFSDIQMTDKYIYTVFHGRTFREIGKNMQNEDGGRFIYVFDLEGKPVVKYTLNRAIYGVCVNEETNTIIATDVNSDEPLVRLLLPVDH